MIHNQTGFALVGAIFLAPVVLAAFCVMAAGYLVITSDAKARHICRTELLNSQQTVADRLNALIKLNPKAEALRAAREEAQQMVDAGVETGPGEIILIARLNWVIAEQVVFAIKQKSLIAEGKFESHSGPLRTRRAVEVALGQDQKVYRDQPSAIASQASSSAANFDLDASPEDSITPDYNPSSDFERSQSMQVNWSVQLLSFLPVWLTGFLQMPSSNVRADCSATLTKEGGFQWTPRLNAAKSSSRFL